MPMPSAPTNPNQPSPSAFAPSSGGPMDPQMQQWQIRFDAALRAAQDPRHPAESPAQFQQRQAAAYQILKQLQMTKPTPQPQPPQGAPMPAPQGGNGGGGASGGLLGGLYGTIANAMRGANGGR